MPEYSSRMSTIVLDVHKLVNKHRAKRGLPAIEFEDRSYLMSEVVSDTIANSESNNRVDGIDERAPLCACKPTCEKQVMRNGISKRWNTFARGHRPQATGLTKGIKLSGKQNFGTNIASFEVQVLDKKSYDAQIKIKDKKTYALLHAVNIGGKDEVTVVTFQPEQIREAVKYFRTCIELLKFPIEVEAGPDHIALTKR